MRPQKIMRNRLYVRIVSVLLFSISWSRSVDSIEETFPIHPHADRILKELRQQGRIHGARWDSALATLTTVCHPMVANGLAHTALSMVNLQKEFVSAPLINCDPETDISTCVAMDDLDGAGLKDLVEIFVRLQAICTALAHSQRIGISEKAVNLASGLNGEVVAELSALKSALRQQAQTRGTDYLERVVGETTETGSYSRLTSAAGFVTDIVSNVASLASEASKSITQLMDKGMYYMCISYILVTYVTLLLVSHWLTCRLLRNARQACFLIAFSNCVVQIWLLHKSRTKGNVDMGWLSPNLTDSTYVHCALLALVLTFTGVRRHDVRLKYLHHITSQHMQICQILQGLEQRRRLEAA
ncbi:uncharacterized protein LOC111259344 isoform X1 [Varroa jacobsoni]|uniref:uncharacterized protein LOC111259344 isoform X1 n=2 Tax=Varroa jacobsoni TaxID=62625 RepID=UPI000BF65193|nr:uncharacterized protein LOC111259344 isoform X1 [Varroa jacobsoni]XP_022687030.1 uncharacterized protein LOC111259344 isoform X1 [Varroa jacobsoni]